MFQISTKKPFKTIISAHIFNILCYLGHLVMVHSFEHWLSAILFICSFYMLNVTYIKPENASFLGNNFRTIKFWHQTALITLANSNAIFIHKIVQRYVVRRLTYLICIHLYVGSYLHQYLIDYDIMFYTKKFQICLNCCKILLQCTTPKLPTYSVLQFAKVRVTM